MSSQMSDHSVTTYSALAGTNVHSDAKIISFLGFGLEFIDLLYFKVFILSGNRKTVKILDY